MLNKRLQSGEQLLLTILYPYHLFSEQSKGGIQVCWFIRQQIVRVIPSSAQVVLNHGLLHIHPLHLSPRAAAGVEQSA